MVTTPTGWSARQTLLTSDGVRLSAAMRRPDGAHRPGGLALVLAHGFTGSWRSRGLGRVASVLSTGPEGSAVIAFDFRGHGRSSGRSTVGHLEVLDLDAAVGWARLLGYRQVATVGFSMGASVVVRHAAMIGGVDAVVAVSGPARWFYRGTAPMRRVHRVVERPSGRLVARVALGTRIGSNRWDPIPEEPRAAAARIAPTPLLIVHGDRDQFFPVEHAYELAQAAGPNGQLWVEPGFGHAEAAIDADLTARIGTWVRSAVGSPVNDPGVSSARP
jgi:pimeloyl-ACP methyl ester carboxylesterase